MEAMVLLVLFLAVGAIWGFIELADEVVRGSTASIDRSLLLAFRDPATGEPLGPLWLQEMMRDFTALGGVGVLTLTTLFAAGYLSAIGDLRTALGVLLAVAGGLLLSQLMKWGFDRPRPDLVSQRSYVSSASFPSGHSMMAAIVYLTLGALLARVQTRKRARAYLIATAVLIVFLVGISRVYLGVHWPTDVLAGWSLGAAWALLCWLITTRVLRDQGEDNGGDRANG